MSDKIHIALIGADPVLATILAEQAKGQAGGARGIRIYPSADVETAPANADVWVMNATTPVPTNDAPLCIRIAQENDDADSGDDLVFVKPFRLAQMLDTAISGAKLRRRKQPRALGSAHVFQPFARLIEETATKRKVSLTEKEASFLCAVLDAGAKGLSRKDAMTELWGYHPDAESHAVDTTLYRLRQKLQECGSADAPIETMLINENGIYKWRGSV